MNTRFIIGLIIILIGVSILFDFNLFRFIIPALLIWIGVQIITGKDGNESQKEQVEAHEDKMKRVLVFSEMNQVILSDNFRGGEIVTVFGNADIDLSQVKSKEKNLKLELTAVFGSIDIRVPEQWIVKSEGVGILGNFENKANGGNTKKSVEVELKGVAVLGEVKVKN